MKTNICDCISKIALTLICTISSVVAAPIEGEGRPDDSIIEQVVTVGTRVPASSMSINGSVASLHDDELNLVGHTHIQESLNRLAGININRGNGQEYLPAIRSPVLTGAGGCGGFLMSEDGIPLRAAGFCNINELFEAHTEAADRVEVLRGSGTALYGSNAMHGVVNVVTPDEDAPSVLGFDLDEDGYSRLRFGVNGEVSDHRVGLRATVTRDDGYRDASGVHQEKLSLRHAYMGRNFSSTSGLTFVNLNQETAGYITGLDSYRIEEIAKRNPNPEAFRDAKALRIWSKVSTESSLGMLLVTPYFRYTDMDFLQHFLPGKPLEENGQRSLGVQISMLLDPSDRLGLTVGADLEYTSAHLRQTQRFETQGPAFLRATIPFGKQYDYTVNATQLAPFAEITWDATDKLSLTLGSRFEVMRYDYKNQMLSGRTREDGSVCGFGGCRYSRPPSAVNSYDNSSFDLSARYELTESNMFYLRVASAFRAPQATELYRLQREQEVADLNPEEMKSMEVGIKFEAEELSMVFSAYNMSKDNVIFRDTNYNNVSDGKTEHRGFELDMSYELSDNINIALSGTHVRHRYDNNPAMVRGSNGQNVLIQGNDVDTAPRNFGSARVSWKSGLDSLWELEWIKMGGYYLEPQNVHRYEGHNLLNLRTSWRVNSDVTVYARVNNLADKSYAKRADYTGFTGYRYFPGTLRSINVGFDIFL